MAGALGRYQLGELLAAGGMAELYRATTREVQDFQRHVAVKRILPHLAADERFVEMFVNEARLVSRLSHPKIVQVYELGRHEGQLFIAMELVDGVDALKLLRASIKTGQRLAQELAAHIAHEVLDALEYAHNATTESGAPLEIVHRDVSPGNVLLSRSGEVKLTDFGVARAREKSHKTAGGTIKGKYAYMSPEQAAGLPVDRRSDLFSAGVVLAELLMSRPLFAAPDDVALIAQVRAADTRRLDKHGQHIDPGLRSVLARALDRDSWQRFQTAREFRDALAIWLRGREGGVSPSEVAAAVAGAIASLGDEPADRLDASGAAAYPDAVAEPPPLELAEVHDFSRVGIGGAPPAPVRPAHAAEVLDLLPSSSPLGGADAIRRPPPPPPGQTGKVPMVEAPLAPLEERAKPPPDVPGVRVIEPGDKLVAGRAPAEEGDLSATSAIRLLCGLARNRATGLLLAERAGIVKDLFLVGGNPDFVNSSDPRERLGEFLVARGLLTRLELDSVLPVLSKFEGNMAAALVGVGLLSPLKAVHWQREQVRHKLVDLCGWTSGRYRWYPDATSPHASMPLHLDTFDALGAGAASVPAEFVAEWTRLRSRRTPVAVPAPPVAPEAFRLGPGLGHLMKRLDERTTIADLTVGAGSTEELLEVSRMLYLLHESGAIVLR